MSCNLTPPFLVNYYYYLVFSAEKGCSVFSWLNLNRPVGCEIKKKSLCFACLLLNYPNGPILISSTYYRDIHIAFIFF